MSDYGGGDYKCDVNNNDTGFIRTLKSLSITRWTCRYDAVRAVDEELPRIVLCLDKIQNDKSSDAKTSSEAMSLLINILDEKFLFAIEVLKIILVHTSKLSSYLQTTKTDFRHARGNVKDVITTLEMLRDEQHHDLVWDKVKIVAKHLKVLIEENKLDVDVKEASIPRYSKFTAGVKNYFRVSYFYEPIDRLVTELKSRFDESPHDVVSHLAEIIFDKEVSDTAFETVCKFYGVDLDMIKADHLLFQHFKVTKFILFYSYR